MADEEDKPASGFLGSIGNWLAEHPALTGSLVGGGLGAATGYMTPGGEDEYVDENDKFRSRLKRALLFGGIGAGGGGLIGYGLGQLGSLKNDNDAPPETSLHTVQKAAPYLAGVGGGIGGTYLTHKGLNAVGNATGSLYLRNDPAKVREVLNEMRKIHGQAPVDAKMGLGTMESELNSYRRLMTDPNSKLNKATLRQMQEAVARLDPETQVGKATRATKATTTAAAGTPAAAGAAPKAPRGGRGPVNMGNGMKTLEKMTNKGRLIRAGTRGAGGLLAALATGWLTDRLIGSDEEGQQQGSLWQ